MELSNRRDAREPWLSHGPQYGSAAEDAAGFLARYTFWWVFPSIDAANKKDRLLHEDMPGLPHTDDPARLFDRCAELWRHQKGKSARIMQCVCWRIQWRLFLYSLLHGLFFLFLMTIDPIMLRVLLDSAQGGNGAIGIQKQLGLVMALSLSMLVRVTCMEICYFASCRVQNNVRSVLVHAIFRKALTLPDHLVDAGRITNLMATDADKVGKWSGLLFSLSQWSWALLSLPAIVYFLYKLVGPAAFVGCSALIIGAVTNRTLGMCLKARNKQVQECRDERSKLMNEMVRGIRTVKLQVWEQVWHERISAAREKEMRTIVTVRILSALNSLVGSILSIMVPVSIFAWYTLVEGKNLDAATAFTTLAWISTLQWSVQALPGIYNMIANLKPSIDRIDHFLTTPISEAFVEEHDQSSQNDVELQSVSHAPRILQHSTDSWRSEEWLKTGARHRVPTTNGESSYTAPSETAAAKVAVEVEDANFGYKMSNTAGMVVSEKTVLRDVNLKVSAGSLVMIAGPVGSAKSTLLASLAGARSALQGVCRTSGSRAYVPQKPFLLNATVKENITFGLPMDEERYAYAVKTAALPQDLKALASGDDTRVGESGVQLSGGQKARVALARAVYADADLIFLDDVLSAVDAHTGRFLWDECINGALLQQGKTIILVSHQIQYLSRPEVTSVVMLREGRVWLQGSWTELAQSGDELLQFVQEWEDQEESTDGQAEDESTSEESLPSSYHPSSVSLEECQAAIARSLHSMSGRRVDSSLIESVRRDLAGESEAFETMREGTISWPDFKVYLDTFGSHWSVGFMLLFMVFSALSQVMSNVWLADFTGSNSSVKDQKSDVGIYSLLGTAASLSNCVQSIILTCCALAASRSIHMQMLQSLLRAPLSFFDASPTGRVLNRFLQDLQNIDNFVPNTVSDQITRSLNIVSQLSLIYIEAPWVLCTLPVMVVPYVIIYKRMRVPNRDSRRLESIAHSPVYTHFGDTLNGRETVRAFGAEARFEVENLKHVGFMAAGLYGNNAVQKWAQALTTQWGCMLYLTCAFTCVGLTRSGTMSAGHMGLVLLYAGSLQRAMMDYMMGAADVETKFVSVERVAEYTRLEGEASTLLAAEEDMHQALCTWPQQADIKMQAVALRYRLCRALVLRGVDLEIGASSKVAFCGRTGCGKSSLFGALSRLYPLAGGLVTIGGIDIARIPLPMLRAAVRVVSQDAFLLSGSLRQNLAMGDGISKCDDVLWHSLEAVGLAKKVRSLGGLDFKVEEGGQNFSAGERQLLTLARVLVPTGACSSVADWRPPHILLCDEAMASVDLVTDEKVHEVVLALESTVLMICHRLQHISRFEQVVVLDSGVVAETGSPQELLDTTRIPLSRLARLCADAGV
eukprot:TRINITY_DN28859_c0_g1_i1.p1 TRINITY_DN28859_c0_g1~~TRINITY_DN28859_c0_g1_i1.p1  ORF type:complete len:1375 (+),score=210.90 TRINITY_DN28859_c0_g1_i1:32-4156(+)